MAGILFFKMPIGCFSCFHVGKTKAKKKEHVCEAFQKMERPTNFYLFIP
jgi:hypothetical protein